MAKKSNALAAKEPVRIRFKGLKNGNQSIYLDIYQNGERSYEFLKLYLIPATTPMAKAQNAETMRAAVAIKSRRVMELTDKAAEIKDARDFSKITIEEWMAAYKKRKLAEGYKKVENLDIVIKRLCDFCKGRSTAVRDIGKDFLLGFQEYLLNMDNPRGGTLSRSTVSRHMKVFRAAMNMALRDGVIQRDPFSMLARGERVREPESKREYLTDEEVRQMIKTPCKYSEVKSAFLFSCFCGLRYSDVVALRWDDITKDSNGRETVAIRMKKTSEPIYLPLSREARRWMPERKDGVDNLVFHLPTTTTTYNIVKRWAADAGIRKKVSFHTSRHTFATLELTYGADLYTVSKLLGHSSVSVTQVYAKIVDKKKVEAVDLLDNGNWG